MYWTLELASKLEDAPWPATKDELIDYATRSGVPLEVLENLQEIEDEGEFISSVLSEISLIKGELMSLDNYYAKSCSQTVFKELYDGYEHRLRKQGLLDFDDMLAMCYELFKERKDIYRHGRENISTYLSMNFRISTRSSMRS